MKPNLFDLNALLLRLAGMVALLSIPFKQLPRRVDDVLPFNTALTSRYSSLIIGVGLLYVAGQLARKKRSAYFLSVLGLLLLITAELLHFRNPLQIALYVAALTSIVKDRHAYVVKSDQTSLRRAVLSALGIMVVMVLFSAVVLGEIDEHYFGKDLSVAATINVIGHGIFNAPLPVGVHPSHRGLLLIQLLRLASIASLSLIIVSLFQPLKLRRPAPRSHVRLARQILTTYSQSPEDYLKLWPDDKHYFFYQESFVAYKLASGVALVLDGASGKPSDVSRLRREFLNYAHENGWSVAIVHADEREAEKWQRYDMQSLFIGSEAAVDTREFCEKTSRDKHFRYVRNKAAKEGLSFEVWEPPLSSVQLQSLRTVSDAWLASGGRREYSFIMGYFDPAYLGECRVGVIKQDGQMVGYANLLPVFTPESASIDHMRSLPGLSQVAMHYLLMELLCRVAESGTQTFNLGLAPLSKLEDQSVESLSERLLPLVKTLGSRYYSFDGLEQFKGKFRPDWEARYIVYSGGPTRLPSVITALTAATAYKPKLKTITRY